MQAVISIPVWHFRSLGKNRFLYSYFCAYPDDCYCFPGKISNVSPDADTSLLLCIEGIPSSCVAVTVTPYTSVRHDVSYFHVLPALFSFWNLLTDCCRCNGPVWLHRKGQQQYLEFKRREELAASVFLLRLAKGCIKNQISLLIAFYNKRNLRYMFWGQSCFHSISTVIQRL